MNADGLVSSCFLDWGRKLVIGDVRTAVNERDLDFGRDERVAAAASRRVGGRQNGVCGNCGQLSHCLPDNIDAHRPMLLEKFKSRVPINPDVEPPGGTNRRFAAVAAE